MMLSDFEATLCASNAILLVTGATGWVGRSVLHELQKLISPARFNHLVRAFGSTPCIISSTAYSKDSKVSIPVFSLQDLGSTAKGRNIWVVHTAFLTKDRLPAYGYSSFVDTNRWITTTVCEALGLAAVSRVVDISSGAAALSEKRGESSLEASVDPYGYLKLQEERVLSESTNAQIFRIYALTGRFIRDPSNFAIGDFLICALKSAQIRIKANGPVIRSYVNAADVAQAALCWLGSKEESSYPISAATHTVTLSTLAAQVTNIFSLPPIILSQSLGHPHSYTASPATFLGMLKRYSISPMTMAEQILDTAEGVEILLVERDYARKTMQIPAFEYTP